MARRRRGEVPPCGTIASYRRGCRCGQCRFAVAMYHYDLRELKKELAEARESRMPLRDGQSGQTWPKPPLRAGAL